MPGSDIKLGAAQRDKPVRVAVLHLNEAKHPRRGERPSFRSGPLLVYRDQELEERFMRFIHITPLGAILLFYLGTAVSLVFALVARVSFTRLILAPLFIVFAVIETCMHVAAGRLPDDSNSLHRLLKVERLLISFSMIAAAVSLVNYGYQVLHDCSSRVGWFSVGSQPKFYTEGYCQHWSGLISLAFGILAVLQIIRFKVMVGGSIIVVALAATLWILPSRRPQQDDAAAVIVRVNLMTIAACAFSCFIRYVDEKQQRRHFEAQEKLIHAADLLSAKRVATLERFLSVLPVTVSKRLRDGQWKSSQIDVASDATVLVTRIHDFPTWSTSMVPLKVAALVAVMQNEVASILRDWNLERVGRLGDTTVAVGNLLELSGSTEASNGIEAAKAIVMMSGDGEDASTPALVAAVHIGAVEGVLQGAHYVRYEVRGPAMEATRSGVQLCGTSGLLLASTAIMGAATNDDGAGHVDSEELVVATSDGECVTFRRLDPQRPVTACVHTREVENLAFFTNPKVHGVDGGQFVSGVSRLLGHRTGSIDGMSSISKRSTTTLESTVSLKPEPLEIVTDRLGFYRFADEDADKVFRRRRTKSVPQQAAMVWFGYAGFVIVILIVQLMELRGPYAIFGTILLVFSVLGSICLGLVPKLLSDDRMAAVNVPWTVVGLFVPLLTVFGCALSRPSIVGLDTRAYVAFGAFMRSYCFNDARGQAIGVPVFSVISALQYLVPGVQENLSFLPMFTIYLLATVLAARNREGSELKNYRRGVIAEAVLQQIEEVTRVQQGLLRSSLPRNVFDAAVAADFHGPRQVHQVLAVVMVIRAAAPSRPAGSTSGRVIGGLGRVLDQVAPTVHLSTAGVLGDDAVVVGPVPGSAVDASSEDETASLREALILGLAITQRTPSSDAPALSVLVDQDTVAHVVELGEQPNYSLLGVSATRLICVGADVSGMVRGLLVTDRVTAMAKASGMLNDVVVEGQAPMSVRGQGVLRWHRIRKR